MDVLTISVAAMEAAASWRAEGLVQAFVPTMGALHDGHLSLLRIAASRADRVSVSIFVNPAQFGPGEDLDRYPRSPERDLEMLERAGADLVFMPSAGEIYPEGFCTWIEVEGMTERLCGAFRPGHFRGVATVCSILFGILRPDMAVFGRKDAQQLAVIRRMVRDLRLGVEIVAAPIVREPDGLAMSSRNAYLTGQERAQAPAIHRGLMRAALAAAGGQSVPAAALIGSFIDEVAGQPLLRIQYAELVDPDTMEPMQKLDRPGLLAVAVNAGSTRLIDNILLAPGRGALEVDP